MTELEEKTARLETILKEMGGAVIALSGGADSTLLLAVAAKVLGKNALAVTARSSTFPERELKSAFEMSEKLGARHRVVDSEELEIEGFAENPADRCYWCKKELYEKIKAIAAEEGLAWVAEGSNVDDRGDYRPGRKALSEAGIRSPLEEAGFTKAQVRELSRKLDLPTWDRPALACLASRFPYHTRITKEGLTQVDRAEETLRALGFRQVRVRHHGDVARVELLAEDLPKALELRERIVEGIKNAGYTYVALDLQGYRMGAMNETLGV